MQLDTNSIQLRQGEVAIVTGANTGIGYEISLGLARTEMTVILACRNELKAKKAIEKILLEVPTAHLDFLLLDLSDLESVRNFSEQFRQKYDKLDVLVNNAGMMSYLDRRSKQGIEMQWATNYFGHFLLTALLMDKMPDSSKSRIVTTSSVVHKDARIDFDDINGDHQKKGKAYGQSKLACLIFGKELNRRIKKAGKNVKAIPVHPGGSASNIFKEMSRIEYYFLKTISPLIAHDNASAAKAALYAALSLDAEGGKYYGPTGFFEFKGKVGYAKYSKYSKQAGLAEKLWTLSEQLTNEKFEL